MAIGIQVTFDCTDPDRLAEFWATALDYVMQPPPPGFDSWDAFLDSIGVPAEQRHTMNAIIDPAGAGPRLLFQKVPEPKVAKNRVHLDVNAGGERDTPADQRSARVDAKVAELVAAGASEVRRAERFGDSWVVLADPEGNEFCVQ